MTAAVHATVPFARARRAPDHSVTFWYVALLKVAIVEDPALEPLPCVVALSAVPRSTVMVIPSGGATSRLAVSVRSELPFEVNAHDVEAVAGSGSCPGVTDEMISGGGISIVKLFTGWICTLRTPCA